MKKLIAAAALAPLCISAQNLSTTIDVDRTVVPVEIQAMPLGTVRPAPLTATSALPVMETAEYAGTADIPATADSTSLDFPSPLPAAPEYPGYVAAGYGPTYNLGVQAGYTLLRDSLTTLSAAASYSGTSYLSRAAEQNRTVSDNSVAGALRFDRRLGGVLLEADASYIYSALKSPWRGISRSNKLNLADAGLRLYGLHRHFDWDVHAGWDFVSSGSSINAELRKLGGAHNSNFNAGTELWWHSSHRSYGMLVKLDFYYANTKNWYEYDNSSEIDNDYYGNILLAWRWNYRRIHLDLGLRTDLFSSGGDAYFRIHPVLDFKWRPWRWFEFYMSTHSFIRPGSLRTAWLYSPYLPGSYAGGIDYRRWQIDFGLNVKPVSGLTMSAKMEFMDGEGVMNIHESSDAVPYMLEWSMCSNWMLEARAKYETSFHDISVDLGYRHYFGDRSYYGNIDRAANVFDIKAKGRVIDTLTVTASFSLRSDRHTTQYWNYDSFQLLTKAKLDIAAYYDLSKRLTVGLALNNITNCEWYILPGIASQGFTAVAMAQYKF